MMENVSQQMQEGEERKHPLRRYNIHVNGQIGALYETEDLIERWEKAVASGDPLFVTNIGLMRTAVVEAVVDIDKLEKLQQRYASEQAEMVVPVHGKVIRPQRDIDN